MNFKHKHTVENRKKESSRILAKYPDRIPVICERSAKSGLAQIDKEKYLVPSDLTMGQFVYVIRKRIKLPPEKAMFIFINGHIPPNGELMSTIYETYRDTDGFLYIKYSGESTFGNGS